MNNLLKFIPIGKKNRKKMEQIMQEAQIYNKEEFKSNLSELRQNNIIMFENGGYYKASTKEELAEFIHKCNNQMNDMQGIIQLAYQEIEKII